MRCWERGNLQSDCARLNRWAKDSTQVMRSQRLIGQSFALPGAPFEVESSCLPKTGGGAERTKKVEDRTVAKSTKRLRTSEAGG